MIIAIIGFLWLFSALEFWVYYRMGFSEDLHLALMGIAIAVLVAVLRGVL